jgi:flavin reductase (DIM6/NTAB) family NADH-FMN oxidoreductase RutF
VTHRLLDLAALGSRARYQLLTSLVVPRPIAWISTRGASGHANLAPFSYFMAVSAEPPLIAVSIGARGGQPKDTLRNIRETGAFCVNVVSEAFLEPMNASAGDYAPEIDEFARAGVVAAPAELVDAPYVAECPAVLECVLYQEVELGGSPNALLIGEVRGVRLADALEPIEGSLRIRTGQLRPVGRLAGDEYALLGEIVALARPQAEQ